MATIVSREVLLLINAYGEACKAAVRAESVPADLPAAQDAELVACGRLVQAVSQPVPPRSADTTDVLRIDFPPRTTSPDVQGSAYTQTGWFNKEEWVRAGNKL